MRVLKVPARLEKYEKITHEPPDDLGSTYLPQLGAPMLAYDIAYDGSSIVHPSAAYTINSNATPSP